MLSLIPLLVHASPTPLNSAQTSAAPSIQPTPDRTDGFFDFQQYYITNFAKTVTADPDLYQDLVDRGIDVDHLDEWAIWGKDPKTRLRSGPFAPYENISYTNDGAIIASSNFRGWDTQKKLQCPRADHESLYGIIPGHKKGGPISNLRCVIQHIVINGETKAVMKTAYDNSGYTINKGDTEWKKWTEVDQPYFFYALLGTESVKGTVWLLKDHAVEIGRKEITEIWTRWTTMNPDI
ncbi:MAG: hypothetical protein Q9179_005167, partial [Wetmoreana sp. 5 TL-2023]